tara:strand:- start:5164 stop:5868 length:705 start_codon:yes stop_codon:yes gene_type:complete
MEDLIYKIGGQYKYPDNDLKIDNGGIGVEFIMNGKLYLSKKGSSYRSMMGQIEFTKTDQLILDPKDCISFRVRIRANENEPGYGWGENGNSPDTRDMFKPTDEIIYIKETTVGTTEDNPFIKGDMGNSERQIFRNVAYRTYTYDVLWNETKSGINISEYDYMYFKSDDYWTKDRHFKKTERVDGEGYFYDDNNEVFESRLMYGSKSYFRLESASKNRKLPFQIWNREIVLNQFT